MGNKCAHYGLLVKAIWQSKGIKRSWTRFPNLHCSGQDGFPTYDEHRSWVHFLVSHAQKTNYWIQSNQKISMDDKWTWSWFERQRETQIQLEKHVRPQGMVHRISMVLWDCVATVLTWHHVLEELKIPTEKNCSRKLHNVCQIMSGMGVIVMWTINELGGNPRKVKYYVFEDEKVK